MGSLEYKLIERKTSNKEFLSFTDKARAEKAMRLIAEEYLASFFEKEDLLDSFTEDCTTLLIRDPNEEGYFEGGWIEEEDIETWTLYGNQYILLVKPDRITLFAGDGTLREGTKPYILQDFLIQ